MQITVDGVKIKPFIFICFSIACNDIWHSDYDCGRVQTLTAMIGTLSDQCFSQWNAKWDSWLICRLAIVAIQAVIVDRLFGPVTFRAQDQWHFFSHLFLHLLFIPQGVSEPELPAVLPPALEGIEELSEAVEGLRTVEEVMRYLEPERWQVDMEELYKPSWHVLGKSFIHSKKARGRTFWMDFWKGTRCWGQKCLHACLLCVFLRRSRSESAEGRSPPVQLHAAQLFRVFAWGAEEDRCHLLAKLPPGESLRWKLRLLLSPLLRLPVRSRQGHEEIPRGKC